MGSFEGIFYSLLCLWWGYNTAVKHVYSQKKNKYKFQGSMTQSAFFCATRSLRAFPYESFVKFILLSAHSAIEYLMNGFGQNKPLAPEIVHHICMLSGFIVGSFIEILIYFGVPFPSQTEYIFTCLSFLIQTLLMVGHIHGDMSIEDHMHKEWAVICTFTFLAMCLETYKPNCLWLIYSRIFFFFTQGTWLMQTAFVVWPQKITNNPYYKWQNNHNTMTWLNVSLMYHMLFVAIVLMSQYLFVYYTFSMHAKYFQQYEQDLEQERNKSLLVIKQLDSKNEKEYEMLMNEDEQDDD